MMSDYLRSALIALAFTPLVALLVQYLATWLTRFRPRYVSALASVASSCVIGALVGVAIAKICAPPHPLSLTAAISNDLYPTKQFVGDVATFCAGFAISSLCHWRIIRGANGERLTSSKAIQLAGAQFSVALIVRLVLRLAL
jgi:hypothetical protein